MRQDSPGPLSRILDRLTIKVKLIGALTIIGVFVALLAYVVLGMFINWRVEDRLASRTDEIVAAYGAGSNANMLSPGVAGSLVEFRDVKSLAIAEVGEPGSLLAVSDANGSNGAGDELQRLLITGEPGADSVPGVQIRTVVVGNPFVAGETQRYLVGVELDEAVIASDLRAGEMRAIALLISGIAILILIAYLLIDRLVTTPLTRLAALSMEPSGGDSGSIRPERRMDEIALARERFAHLVSASASIPAGHSESGYYLPEAIPDLWLRLDTDLNVLETRFSSVDDGISDGSTLVMSHLSELLSVDVVDHVDATLRILGRGDEDAFEFSVGIKSYRALLTMTNEGPTLEISESASGVQAVSSPAVEASQILADLLEDLPIGVMDADATGVLRYANGNAYGTRVEGELIGKRLDKLVPSHVSGDALQALRDARHTLSRQSFVVPPDPARDRPGIKTHVIPVTTETEVSLFILAIEEGLQAQSEADSERVSALEEQLWTLELQISDYESRIEELSNRPSIEDVRQVNDSTSELVAEMTSPMQQLMDALEAVAATTADSDSSDGTGELRSAVLSVAAILDRQLGTDFAEHSHANETPPEKRFHLATLLDELAISASERERGTGSRISAFVQPSLPKWLFGREHEARHAILQMIEFAQLVAGERPLILAAMQDASEGRSVQVRFEVQIPPPALTNDDMELLRGCISGDVPDDGMPSAVRNTLEAGRALSFEALDIELVKVNEDATAIRCSSSFQISEDIESENAWVRGLRTLIIQTPGPSENGIQTALDAFGIIGYVVGDENSLVEALQLAEEYSNPYRFVLADVDTPGLESFAYQLFDGDAPVVLVGKKSESAMVGAISAGYDGYLAKPVRQVDLLEVILSTVEPPPQVQTPSRRASAA